MVRRIAHLRREKNKQGEASKATADLGKAICREHKKLNGRLQDLYVWKAAASEDESESVELPGAVLQGMLQGEPAPWHLGGASSSLRLSLGRRYFVATNAQTRCAEQLSILPLEKRRLAQWLQMMLDLISGRIGVLEEACRPPHVEKASWLLTPEDGLTFWLKWHAKRLAEILCHTKKVKMVVRLPCRQG